MSIFYDEWNIKSGIMPECVLETKRNEFYNFVYSNVKFTSNTRFIKSSSKVSMPGMSMISEQGQLYGAWTDVKVLWTKADEGEVGM